MLRKRSSSVLIKRWGQAGYGHRAFNALVTLFICGELLSAVFTGMYVGGEVFTTVMQARCSRGVTSVAAVA